MPDLSPPIRWLQWGTVDLAGGKGGVETHARCLARELRRLGVEASLSCDPAALLDPSWDVVQLHGSALRVSRLPRGRAVRLFTLHGTTIGRMAACGEWLWPGGYRAQIREIAGIAWAEAVLSVSPDLWLLHAARRLGRRVRVCGNGWDSWEAGEEPGGAPPLPAALEESLSRLDHFILFVGRGNDPVKGADRIRAIIACEPDWDWVAVPGDGFEGHRRVVRTGPLEHAQVRSVLERAAALVLPSRYEGGPLVLLEALALGVPVVSTPVGPWARQRDAVAGLFVVPAAASATDFRRGLRAAGALVGSREGRASSNRKILPRWSDVARVALDAVREIRGRGGKGGGDRERGG